MRLSQKLLKLLAVGDQKILATYLAELVWTAMSPGPLLSAVIWDDNLSNNNPPNITPTNIMNTNPFADDQAPTKKRKRGTQSISRSAKGHKSKQHFPHATSQAFPGTTGVPAAADE